MTTTDDQQVTHERLRLTEEERRAGFKRLGLVTIGLVVTVLLISAVFMVLGAPARGSLSAGSGLVGIMLVIGGVAAFTRTSPVRRSHGSYSMAPAESRREAERLALGLLGFGITFSALALVLG